MAYNARVRLSSSLGQLLRTEMEKAIYEANLGDFDSYIAKRYLVDHMPQIDIAIELDKERSTISKRIPHIVERVEQAAQKLNIT